MVPASPTPAEARSTMRRLLFIAHRVPYPPDKGERVRAFHEIRALSGRFRVTAACLAHGPADVRAAEGLRPWCEQLLVAPAGGTWGFVRGALGLLAGRSVTEGFFHSHRLHALIADAAGGEPFDVAISYSSSTLPYALAAPARARVADVVDVDSAKWADYAARTRWPKRWLYAREAAGVKALERLAVERCDAVVMVSDAEARALGLEAPNVLAVSNGVDAQFFAPAAAAPADIGPAPIVFTGTMDYRPNVEGVCWFVREVWPRLRQRVPGVTFAIVGRDPAPAVRRLTAAPGVIVTGTVPDVRPYLAAARAAVCPLHIARGIQNKILEAMAMGLATVGSPAALEGLELALGREVLPADSPELWAEHLGRLLTDAAAREAIGSAARRCVLERYSWEARMAPLVALCERLSTPGGPTGPPASSGTPAAAPRATAERKEHVAP